MYTRKIKSLFSLVVALAIIYSCNNQQVAKEQNKDSAAMTKPDTARAATSNFYAVCEEKLPLPSHGPLGWCGPKRSTNEEAKADTAQHNKDFPTHSRSLSICSGSCPTCE